MGIRMVLVPKKFDRDERFKIDMDPEAAIKEILDGAGTEGQEVEMDEPEDEA
jgi:hypothetical protein